jgi:hypothetical protein
MSGAAGAEAAFDFSLWPGAGGGDSDGDSGWSETWHADGSGGYSEVLEEMLGCGSSNRKWTITRNVVVDLGEDNSASLLARSPAGASLAQQPPAAQEKSYFVLQFDIEHEHEGTDAKLLGIFLTLEAAKRAMRRDQQQQGWLENLEDLHKHADLSDDASMDDEQLGAAVAKDVQAVIDGTVGAEDAFDFEGDDEGDEEFAAKEDWRDDGGSSMRCVPSRKCTWTVSRHVVR